MKTQNRNGVLGLETAKAVMVTFLVLAVIGIATLLCLTALNDGVGDSIDNEARTLTNTVTNETVTWLNATGFTLNEVNSTNSDYTITFAYNESSDIGFPIANVTVSTAGIVTNATDWVWEGDDSVDLSYTYVHAYTVDTGKVDSVVGNVSSGLVTFFGSTGTIFSILIVVVIILAISIIIWAVGRFGQTGRDQDMNL
jgi:hypothetical protein